MQAPGTAMREHSGALAANGTRIIYVAQLSASSSEPAPSRPLPSEYGTPSCPPPAANRHALTMPSEYGTFKTVKARFGPWLYGRSPQNVLGCTLLARRRRVANGTRIISKGS